MVPQNLPPAASTTVFPAHDARLLRYQDVLAKMSASHPSSKSNQYPTESTPYVSDGWISDEDDVEEMKSTTPIKSEGVGKLLGGFADAESATD